MRIAFNPSTVEALITPPNNKDITFDLRGHNIFARGVKFCGTDTNTWRDIKINNVSIDSNILDLRDGDNTTLTNINGVVTINSTWRPVVDNLTSDSTTSSLSANQGRVLAGLINGKSDSDHNHDGRYLRKDTNDSTPYQYTFTKTNGHAIRVGTVRGTAVGSQTGEYIHLYERVAIGSPSGWGSRPAPSYGLATYGGAWLATDTGNVGIGTATPSARLEVNGTVKATSFNGFNLVVNADNSVSLVCD